jgi:hypothetical protein
MVSKCAIPVCLAALRYPHESRILNIERSVDAGESGQHRIELYWLCMECSSALKLVPDHSSGVFIRSRYPPHPAVPVPTGDFPRSHFGKQGSQVSFCAYKNAS